MTQQVQPPSEEKAEKALRAMPSPPLSAKDYPSWSTADLAFVGHALSEVSAHLDFSAPVKHFLVNLGHADVISTVSRVAEPQMGERLAEGIERQLSHVTTRLMRVQGQLDRIEAATQAAAERGQPERRSDSTTRKAFDMLTEAWKRDTRFTSSLTDVVLHPAYQRIIGMGETAVPLIVASLKREVDHWFWALSAITGENPVPEGDEGDLDAMARHWVDWYAAKGS